VHWWFVRPMRDTGPVRTTRRTSLATVMFSIATRPPPAPRAPPPLPPPPPPTMASVGALHRGSCSRHTSRPVDAARSLSNLRTRGQGWRTITRVVLCSSLVPRRDSGERWCCGPLSRAAVRRLAGMRPPAHDESWIAPRNDGRELVVCWQWSSSCWDRSPPAQWECWVAKASACS